MKYRLLERTTLDLSALPPEDLAFLLDLMQRAFAGEDFFALERLVCATGAYPLRGGRVTRAIHDSVLFRVAEDIVDRVGIRQGTVAPDPGDEHIPVDDYLSVTMAAQRLGITRAAVIKAAQAGRLEGSKVGHAWVLLRRSVDAYRVARHRVKAGRAAHTRVRRQAAAG